MTPRRICRLDDLDVFRVEYLARPRWPFSLWMKPRWLPTLRWNLFLDHKVPMEYSTHEAAIAALERLRRSELEVDARDRNDWNCDVH